MPAPGRWAPGYRHKQLSAAASLPGLTMKWRVPYCNNGKRREGGRRDIQHSNREAKYRNLFWQNRLNRLQREEYSVLGPFFLPLHLICHEVHECSDQCAKTRRRERRCQRRPLSCCHRRPLSCILSPSGFTCKKKARVNDNIRTSDKVIKMGHEWASLLYVHIREDMFTFYHSCSFDRISKAFWLTNYSRNNTRLFLYFSFFFFTW